MRAADAYGLPQGWRDFFASAVAKARVAIASFYASGQVPRNVDSAEIEQYVYVIGNVEMQMRNLVLTMI
ncbi:MAG: hypothetical protein ACOH2D_15730 [Gelidibacter sp.]